MNDTTEISKETDKEEKSDFDKLFLKDSSSDEEGKAPSKIKSQTKFKPRVMNSSSSDEGKLICSFFQP